MSVLTIFPGLQWQLLRSRNMKKPQAWGARLQNLFGTIHLFNQTGELAKTIYKHIN